MTAMAMGTSIYMAIEHSVRDWEKSHGKGSPCWDQLPRLCLELKDSPLRFLDFASECLTSIDPDLSLSHHYKEQNTANMTPCLSP
jgi:hypothetical protein